MPRPLMCSQVDIEPPEIKRHRAVTFWELGRHSLLHDHNGLTLSQHRKGGCASPSPFTGCPADVHWRASTGNSFLPPPRPYLFGITSNSRGTLPLPGYLPAPLPHTHLAPSPAFRVLAAKSMDMLHWLLYSTGLCAVLL